MIFIRNEEVDIEEGGDTFSYRTKTEITLLGINNSLEYTQQKKIPKELS